ncbi:penicillin-binding protein 1C [candidate division TA06 bacterium]|uniref:peptidoglycan glycosyltransferase n=1 Tax=candidate division TA06 bacterium TaxID=2250710 RepID=A0A660SI84_UNCT6|nr:MAG: penicillin-binding protein 1C [candidate division TA06 bacterium]
MNTKWGIDKIKRKWNTFLTFYSFHKLNISIIFVCVLFIFGLSFRFTPYLFPIKKKDINRKHFDSVKFYDRHGNLLQEVLSQNSKSSVYVSIDKVSPYFLQAVIVSEDKNFYKHRGIDYRAICRAIYQNIKSKRIVSGASTITLQLARMINPGKRTMIKKIKEAYLAYRLEAGMDKETILEEYINKLPMGGNLYGVEGGARAYFGIPSSDLTLAQATFLASIPNSPNKLNPYHNLKEIKVRQKYVLEKIYKQGLIPKERIKGVLKENVLLKPQISSFLAPHFAFHLMCNIPGNAQVVRTTIDCELQKMVQEQINKVIFKLKKFNVTNASAILLDNHTGEVLAYVGSADYFNKDNEGENDGVRSARQPGSTLKPFLYLMAMEEGFNPATIISDIPTYYRMPKGLYSPKNYSEKFHGPTRLREALANSLNIPAVRVLAKIGIDRFLSRLRKYEFYSLNKDADYYGIGLILGGGEVNLYELTRAYMCLARMGHFIPIKEILAINGEKQNEAIERKTISTYQMNYLIANILSDRFARTSEYGFTSVLNFPFLCAVKTGTSFHFCDNWTIGFTKDFTLGVWVGNFNHSSMQNVSGVSGAGPIFANIMMMLYNKREYPGKYPIPDNIVKVPICALSGKKPNRNCSSIIEEIIPERDLADYEKDSCNMHIYHNGERFIVLPEKYRKWGKKLGIKTPPDEYCQEQKFSISNPKDGVTYYRLSNLSPEFQSIRFELKNSNKDGKIEWILNGIQLQTTSKEHSFLWQVKPGSYILKAISEDDNNLSDSVEFIVK